MGRKKLRAKKQRQKSIPLNEAMTKRLQIDTTKTQVAKTNLEMITPKIGMMQKEEERLLQPISKARIFRVKCVREENFQVYTIYQNLFHCCTIKYDPIVLMTFM